MTENDVISPLIGLSKSLPSKREQVTLTFGLEASPKEVASQIERWNTLMKVAYPGVAYFDTRHELAIEDDGLQLVHYLYADSRAWQVIHQQTMPKQAAELSLLTAA